MTTIIEFLAKYNMQFVFGIIVFFSLIEVIFGYFAQTNRTKSDLLVETVNTFFLMLITKPLIMFVAIGLMKLLMPSTENVVLNWHFAVQLVVFLFVDDVMQYWYHRLAHEYKWLWKLHRAHHAAEEMGFLVSYRESVWYFFIMPNIWWLGIFTFLGGGVAVAVGLVLKQFVIISSHSLATWDSFFYKRPALMPIMRLLERIFITPAFHHAHHAKTKIDDIGNPNGNYGNMLSIWDQLFGSAHFTHKFPVSYGLQFEQKESWAAHSFWPVVTEKNPESELSKGHILSKTTQSEPAVLVLREGDYLYCTCGFSKNQPFCDGSHHGTKFHPVKFAIKKERSYKLCQCKLCDKAPFCDDSHLKIKEAKT
jgi:sterol desaturase/sphingolipid hydroxylase (fatty acid hydroxylase superfamily)/CDGSH-type Zn-finger protein